jgi:hypothetical protein
MLFLHEDFDVAQNGWAEECHERPQWRRWWRSSGDWCGLVGIEKTLWSGSILLERQLEAHGYCHKTWQLGAPLAQGRDVECLRKNPRCGDWTRGRTILSGPCARTRTPSCSVRWGGVRIHPGNACMSGRHGEQYVAQCVVCAALPLTVWQ